MGSSGSGLAGRSGLIALSTSSSFLGINTNRRSGLSSSFGGHGSFCKRAASAAVTSASKIIGLWSIIPRSGGSQDGIEDFEDSLAIDTTSSSTVGLGGGGPRCLRGGSRLRLLSRGISYWEVFKKDGAVGGGCEGCGVLNLSLVYAHRIDDMTGQT